MSRRIASLWFPRLASDRALRARPVEGPFALTLTQNNTQRLWCLNEAAETEGLQRGMGLADARARSPDIITDLANPQADHRFLRCLARWAGRYCPWVGLEGPDGLVLDITGSDHLFGGEEAMATDMRARLNRAGLSVWIGIAGTRGAAWARARFAEGILPGGETRAHLGPLPVAALRLDRQLCTTLERLGLRTITDLAALPRPALARRFGTQLVQRLDQAFGEQPEQVSPLADPPDFSARLTLPEPIGLVGDVMAALERLLIQLCARLNDEQKGARVLLLTLRRVDRASCGIELHLAHPMRDAARIGRLFEKHVEEVDAGFGIDQLHLRATRVEKLPFQQMSQQASQNGDKLADLITRLGSRVGLENITRYLPAESHIPERGFLIAPAAYSEPAGRWPHSPPRPLRFFPPEPIATSARRGGVEPPPRFRWHAMSLSKARATGPERIAPEWWWDDPAWRSGVRDYWRVETHQGRRLWLFHTPQNPSWFVHGEFA